MLPNDSAPFAVLMDGGSVFFAVRDLYPGMQFEYPALATLLVQKSPGQLQLPKPSPSPDGDRLWAMWSSSHPENEAQARFLEYSERTLGWFVRRFEPSDANMLDHQSTLALSKSSDGGSSRIVNRLIRFDASIAYTIGRVADTHKLVLITDSFALADPLVRAAALRKGKNCIAFFGKLLDPRWPILLRGKAADHVDFIDLDEYQAQLFGKKKAAPANTWEDRFPIR